jgi:HEAT repeat protein
VVDCINDEDVEVQLEAVRAAGELSIKKARLPILRLYKDPDALNEDMRTAVIWSLSQIGGQKVRTLLEGLLDACEDDEEAEFLENAIDNLDFVEGNDIHSLLDVGDVKEGDMYGVIDITEDVDEENDDDLDSEFLDDEGEERD